LTVGQRASIVRCGKSDRALRRERSYVAARAIAGRAGSYTSAVAWKPPPRSAVACTTPWTC